jgi:hypothetical protein
MSVVSSMHYIETSELLTDVSIDLARSRIVLECDLQRRHSACSSNRGWILMDDRLSWRRLRLLRYRCFV